MMLHRKKTAYEHISEFFKERFVKRNNFLSKYNFVLFFKYMYIKIKTITQQHQSFLLIKLNCTFAISQNNLYRTLSNKI